MHSDIPWRVVQTFGLWRGSHMQRCDRIFCYCSWDVPCCNCESKWTSTFLRKCRVRGLLPPVRAGTLCYLTEVTVNPLTSWAGCLHAPQSWEGGGENTTGSNRKLSANPFLYSFSMFFPLFSFFLFSLELLCCDFQRFCSKESATGGRSSLQCKRFKPHYMQFISNCVKLTENYQSIIN